MQINKNRLLQINIIQISSTDPQQCTQKIIQKDWIFKENRQSSAHKISWTWGICEREAVFLQYFLQLKELDPSKSKKDEFHSQLKSSACTYFDCYPANSYEIPSFIDSNFKQEKGFTCRRRFSSKQLNVPSPDTYETTNFINKFGPRVGFAKSKRSYLTAELKRSESVPGPGSHQTDSNGHMKFKSLSGSKFSKAKLARFLNSSSHKISFINP